MGCGVRRRPNNDVEGFFVSTDFKCLRREPTNDGKGFFVSADFKCFKKGVWGWVGRPLMMVKDYLFLLISNDLERECRAGEGAH